MALDEGSPTAATESGKEVISPITLNLIHLSQNPEPTPTKTVENRMSIKQRRTPVTRNEDFFMVKQTSAQLVTSELIDAY
jgi:hypothetical protein